MIWKTIHTFYDKNTDETVVRVTGLHKSVELREKGKLLTLDKDFKMRQLQRKAVEELKNEEA